MSELMSLKGTNGTITAYDDRVVISRSGFLSIASQGFKGDRTYFYKDLSSVEYKKPGLTNGYFQFIIAGSSSNPISNTLMGTSKDSMEDENAVILRAFNKSVPADADKMYQLILSQMQTCKNSSCGNTLSAADEILKFKSLLDSGIITQTEFDAKKKQLLNL